MNNPCYVGVENEFVLYSNAGGHHKTIEFPDVFSELMQRYDAACFRKGNTCIRTMHGSSIYADGDEAEVCTPPVLVERGFATQLRDAVHNARNDLATFLSIKPDLAVVGYSMHHNISVRPQLKDNVFMRRYAVPLAMFGLTPSSIGINMRGKENRRELLGDHIPDENQVMALNILYAAAQLTPAARPRFIAADESVAFKCGYHNLVSEGRTSIIRATTDCRDSREATAQEFLDDMWRSLRPRIEEITTHQERKVLEGFISGKRELEIDKQTKYDAFAAEMLRDTTTPSAKIFMPLSRYREAKAIPAGAAMALAILGKSDVPRDMKLPRHRLISMEWDNAQFAIENRIYRFATLNELEIAGRTVSAMSYPNVDMLGGMARLMRRHSHRQIYESLRDLRFEGKLVEELEYAQMIERWHNARKWKLSYRGKAMLRAYEDVLFPPETSTPEAKTRGTDAQEGPAAGNGIDGGYGT